MIASKYGKVLVATRDAESRTRFLGYRADRYKLFAFVLSACMAGVAGALYVPQVGIINPGEFAPAKSIEVVVWVAVGGRGTLVGPILGGSLVNALKTYFTGGGDELLWRIALLPLLGLAIFAWLRRGDGWARTPLIGAAIGAAIAALGFVLPDGLASWWGYAISGIAVVAWIIAGNNPQVAGAALGALIMALLREPNTVLPLAPYWPFFLGGLFVAATLLLPRGIVGTVSYGWNAWKARRESIRAQEGRDADLTSPEPLTAQSDAEAKARSEEFSGPTALPPLEEADGKKA